MSWDVIFFDLGGDSPPIGEMGTDFKPKSMGLATDVRAKISAQFPKVNWSDPSWGVYDGNGYSLEFNVGNEQEIDALMIHVRGSGEAVSALLQLSVPNGWTPFDCASGEFIDPRNPSNQGWLGFQKYRDKCIGDKDA